MFMVMVMENKMMRHPVLNIPIMICLMLFLTFGSSKCQASDLLKDAQSMAFSPGTDKRVANGLKEALEIGIQNAIASVSIIDGYYKNPNIKIPLPEKIKNMESVLRGIGFGPQIDEFEVSMNRAAEAAAPEARTLFVATIKQITFEDARQILQGPEDAATAYFREKTGPKLFELFKPIVQNAMGEVGVTHYYQQIFDRVKQIPFAGLSGLDLDAYVTDNALNGLFYMVAEEEKKIRTDPAARVTDLLKDVFGKK
jgi:hypothetical protein